MFSEKNNQKIILIGDGDVGASFAFASVLQGIGQEIGIIDINLAKAEGDALDLSHASAFSTSMKLYAADYSACHNADIIVIAAGYAQNPGETRLDLITKNLALFQDIINKIMSSGFKGIFLVATNPVDILTYATWKLSGLPSSRVIGSGTSLDSARFRQAISAIVQIDMRSIHAYILGEHGDSEFPVWSHANIGGLPILDWLKDAKYPEECNKIFAQVKNAAYDIISKKGSTCYGIAAALARITQAILYNENYVLPVSTILNGEYGAEDIYIGVPAVLNRCGVREVIEIPLSPEEKIQMQHSVNTLKTVMKDSVANL